MRAVLTRCLSASVTVDDEVVGSFDAPETGGLLALIGVSIEDVEAGKDDPAVLDNKISTMARKIAELRILDGETSVESAGAPVLVVSQFTLYGRTAKGRRPSWSDAAPGSDAEPIINKVIESLRARDIHVEEGRFGAMMKVASVNDGPFTVLVET
ncbi:MAG: D-aminoacyl-tRNA deacylase [Corynebacterium casei]|uniref:D-tyrosyl-tRNA(Tyr) deacylase n=2 Tax=Corynebacterium casei TaxID=160386 RepID=G7HVN1_9CORY|nr:D-aminoacyl-tRNA deacylase [Corynebacterium casei]AHI19880.1 D-tyrosyl-tRNA(Tyr) deacylase [Corynebacterium casei LMG S-19264]MDN5706319.1 D-aminoacyl-tRNA deacylase [Corynebacterium casei]MDN5728633.1 D-aminoacyl-tRNA deacylase [Corynebacterium casei]MDN5739739.1 D-aminoacyl-tRNA deacylase [Corynebacterium casei]MDN5799788.1 D-aminoacyl-tRNA deacylase [Corynebacterium casei]